jgi:hypothetical protein
MEIAKWCLSVCKDVSFWQLPPQFPDLCVPTQVGCTARVTLNEPKKIRVAPFMHEPFSANFVQIHRELGRSREADGVDKLVTNAAGLYPMECGDRPMAPHF